MLLAVMAVAALASAAPGGGSADRYQELIDADDLEELDRMRVKIQRSIAVSAANESQLSVLRYDWAYLNWRMGHLLRGSDRNRSKALLKEAEKQLDLVVEREPENAEARALRGSAIGDRIGGPVSGALLGRRASAAHKRAFELAPENPRIALLRGIGFYYTPKAFGGGVANAEEELRRSVELFDRQPSDDDWPSWGRVDALGWLGIVVAERGGIDEARELYGRALELRPENRWVRDELLPALDE